MNKIKILIADDHTLVRQGMLALLSTIPDVEVVGEAANGLEAIALFQKLAPDVILMDLVMPEMDGIQAAQQIVAQNPAARILVITSFSDDERILQAIHAGALGYLLKDSSSDELLQAVRAVSRGEAHLQAVVAHKLMRKVGTPEQPPAYPALTEREHSVLQCVVQGLSNKEIAVQLYLSERTVEAHVRNIMKKLRQASRIQLALFALKEGLVDPS